jgi:hypothetical protein
VVMMRLRSEGRECMSAGIARPRSERGRDGWLGCVRG